MNDRRTYKTKKYRPCDTLLFLHVAGAGLGHKSLSLLFALRAPKA